MTMKKSHLTLIVATMLAMVACKTPTGTIDPIKTEKVVAIFSVTIADAVTLAVTKKPKSKPYLQAVAVAVCSLTSGQTFTPDPTGCGRT